MSKCIICQQGGHSLVSYCGGKHHYHTSCLLKWESVSSTSKNLYTCSDLNSNGNNSLLFLNKSVSCPYCKNDINLTKNTRISAESFKIMNYLEWYISRVTRNGHSNNETVNWKPSSEGFCLKRKKSQGICEKCYMCDDVRFMKTIEKNKDSDSVKWLCRTCQQKSDDMDWNYSDDINAKNQSKYLEYNVLISIHLEFLNYVHTNRHIVRKDKKLHDKLVKLANRFIRDHSVLKEYTPEQEKLMKICSKVSNI